MRVTILDVIDNFLLPNGRDVRTMPGTAIAELGEHVRAFAASPQGSDLDEPGEAVYLGGWPSANFWSIGGSMLLTSLLYSRQLLVRDPISDWFSTEQIYNEHALASRPGYWKQSGEPNILETRAFLANVLPGLYQWRPLIEAGVVVLTSSEDHALTHQEEIAHIRSEVTAAVLTDPVKYSQAFEPGEIAVEDNVRGMFVFAGGEREQQLRRAQSRGVAYFAREFHIATTRGAVYTAPFQHEAHLCDVGLGAAIPPSQRVVRALLSSDLPVLRGLNPDLVSKVHSDESFGQFRSQLHTVYQNVPVEAEPATVAAYMHDQEAALLAPLIRQAEKEVDRGAIGRLGVALDNTAFTFGAAFASGAMQSDPVATTGVAAMGSIVDVLRAQRRDRGTQRVWQQLLRHNRSVADEMVHVRAIDGQAAAPYWGIPEKPSMNVVVSSGQILADHIPQPELLRGPGEGSPTRKPGRNELCTCGSGLKFKRCCYGITNLSLSPT